MSHKLKRTQRREFLRCVKQKIKPERPRSTIDYVSPLGHFVQPFIAEQNYSHSPPLDSPSITITEELPSIPEFESKDDIGAETQVCDNIVMV